MLVEHIGERVAYFQYGAVIQRVVDPVADKIFYVDKICHHPLGVELPVMQSYFYRSVVPVQMRTLAGVSLQTMSIAKCELSGNGEHGYYYNIKGGEGAFADCRQRYVGIMYLPRRAVVTN